MFTGLVQAVGRVRTAEPADGGRRLVIEGTELDLGRIREGDSVACNGACLTVARHDGHGALEFFVGPETLLKTQLGQLVPGSTVNLETALRWGDELGGHHVSGHVDGCAVVVDYSREGQTSFLTLQLEAPWIDWVVPTGSLAVRGVSLTVASVDPVAQRVCIMLIPHTLDHTNLATLRIGEAVEVEFDLHVKAIAQTVARLLPTMVPALLSRSGAEPEADPASGVPTRSILPGGWSR